LTSSTGCRVSAAARSIPGLLVALAVALFAAVSCKSAEKEIDPFDAQPVVNKLPGAVAPTDADAPERAQRAQAALAAAEEAWRSGDALTALAVANQALAGGGIPSGTDAALREIRAKARASVVSSKVCRVRVIPGKDAVADGSPIPLTIEFANVSSATLTVPKAGKGTSDALVILTLTRQDYDIFGNSRSFDYTLPVPVREDLVLEPGRTHEVRLSIPADMAKLVHKGFSVMQLSGQFRPVVLRVGETEFFDAIPIEKASVRIFLAGYEPLAEDPLGSLQKAVAKRSPPHILTAAELLAPRDREAARTFLAAAKAKDPDLTQVIDASLARIGTH
jgi:hypothetical protein